MKVLTPEQVRAFLPPPLTILPTRFTRWPSQLGCATGELLGCNGETSTLTSAADRSGGRCNSSKASRTRVCHALKPTLAAHDCVLSQRAVDALRTHHDRQTFHAGSSRTTWRSTTLVFRGRREARSTVLVPSRRSTRASGGRPPQSLRFDDLRHTAATLALMQGVHPKVVSEMLGHSSSGTWTLDTIHLLPTMHKQARGSDGCHPRGVAEKFRYKVRYKRTLTNRRLWGDKCCGVSLSA